MEHTDIVKKVQPYVDKLLDYYKSKKVLITEIKQPCCHNFQFINPSGKIIITISAHNMYGFSRISRLKDDKNELIIDDEYYVLTYMKLIINKFLGL